MVVRVDRAYKPLVIGDEPEVELMFWQLGFGLVDLLQYLSGQCRDLLYLDEDGDTQTLRIPVQFGLDAAVHDFLANRTVFVDGCPAVEPPPHPVGGVGVVDDDLRIFGNVT